MTRRQVRPGGTGMVSMIVLTAAACLVTYHVGQLNGSVTKRVLVDPSVLARSVPVLSLAQRQQATTLTQESPVVRHLVHGKKYSVTGAVPWTSADGRLIGAVTELIMHPPTSLEGVWETPRLGCGGQAAGSYRVDRYRVMQTHVHALEVLLDLRRQRVVGISAGPGAELVGSPRFDRSRRSNGCSS